MTSRIIIIEDQPLQMDSTAKLVREAAGPARDDLDIIPLPSEHAVFHMIENDETALKDIALIILDVSLPLLGREEAMPEPGNAIRSMEIVQEWWEKWCRDGARKSDTSLDLKISGSHQKYAGIRCALAAQKLGFPMNRLLYYTAFDTDDTMKSLGIRRQDIQVSKNGVLKEARLFNKITHDDDLRAAIAQIVNPEEGGPPESASN